MINLIKKIFKQFDLMEDRLRAKLSRSPILYALLGSVGIVLIWRGIWTIADDLNMPGWVSFVFGVLLTMVTGLFVSFFIGEKIIISGIRREKRIDEKTEEEIKKEEIILKEIESDIKEIKEELSSNKK